MPELEKIRLNSQKRQALKKEWANTVYNNMPLQVDEDQKEAQENYRTVRSDVWDNVITPNVEANFPMADMKILQKYSRSGGYGSFTESDSCFYFKPTFSDDSEAQYNWTMKPDEYNALYHNELQARGHQATLDVEYKETQRQENPHFYSAIDNMKKDYSSIAKANGTYEDFALLDDYSYHHTYRANQQERSDNDFGKYRKVVVSGSCHSRCMMMSSQSDWDMLKIWAKAQSRLTNAHRELWKVKYQLITDMNSIIEQSKFIADVEQYWTNVRECVNFDNTDIGRELSIVSEQTKTRLSQAMNNIKLDDKEPELVVVNASASGFSLVNQSVGGMVVISVKPPMPPTLEPF